MWWKISSNVVGCLTCTKQSMAPTSQFLNLLFFFSKIIIIVQQANIPLLFKSLLIVTKHLLMFVLDCQIMSMNLKSYVGLFCVVMVNIKIYLILTKVWKVLICICWGIRDMGINHLNKTTRNLVLFHYPNSSSF